MKKKLFRRFIALVSMVSILVSTMGICSSASTLADNTIFKFESSFTDSTNATFSSQMLVNHTGQTFTTGNVLGTFVTKSTVPTNDEIYLNVSFYVIYRATPSEVASTAYKFYPEYIGFAMGNTTYTSTLSSWYSFIQSRVVSEITVTSRLSTTRATGSTLGNTYESLVTGRAYEHMITRTREGIIDHGYDYLN